MTFTEYMYEIKNGPKKKYVPSWEVRRNREKKHVVIKPTPQNPLMEKPKQLSATSYRGETLSKRKRV
jgi:hypothetical protein